MTLVVTILIGVGAVLISSAIDCSDIASTFMKIINNQAIDWSGNACAGTGNTNPAQNVGSAQTQAYGPGTTKSNPTLSSGKCPPGQTQYGTHCCPAGYLYVEADGKCHQVGARR